ncbi:MAG: hypothetical protein ACRDYD_05015, partial [Acidimicrobiales bacterium]
PHAGLDSEGRDLLDDLLAELPAQGVTAVIASHESDRLATLWRRGVVTRGVLIGGGRVLSETRWAGEPAAGGSPVTAGAPPAPDGEAAASSGPLAGVLPVPAAEAAPGGAHADPAAAGRAANVA